MPEQLKVVATYPTATLKQASIAELAQKWGTSCSATQFRRVVPLPLVEDRLPIEPSSPTGCPLDGDSAVFCRGAYIPYTPPFRGPGWASPLPVPVFLGTPGHSFPDR
jgi:hypothetical protein